VDGPHHFLSDGQLRPQDKLIDCLLKKEGWQVLRMNYKDINDKDDSELKANLKESSRNA